MKDCISGQCYSVNSSAEVSVLPATCAEHQIWKNGLPLRAANGSIISTFGEYTCLFTLASGELLTGLSSWPISANLSLVQTSSMSTVYSLTSSTASCVTPKYFATAFLLTSDLKALHLNVFSVVQNRYYAILKDFPHLTTPQVADKIPKHGVQHCIITDTRPTSAKARRLPLAKLSTANKEFDNHP